MQCKEQECVAPKGHTYPHVAFSYIDDSRGTPKVDWFTDAIRRVEAGDYEPESVDEDGFLHFFWTGILSCFTEEDGYEF